MLPDSEVYAASFSGYFIFNSIHICAGDRLMSFTVICGGVLHK